MRATRKDLKDVNRRVTQRADVILPRRAYKSVTIDKGNTLETGQDGVNYYDNGVMASVPAAYDPDAQDSFTDGIGRGTLSVNGVAIEGYVLVVNDDRGSFRNALFQGDVVWVGDPVLIPVAGGGHVVAYPVG
jgi:hypothetical protein